MNKRSEQSVNLVITLCITLIWLVNKVYATSAIFTFDPTSHQIQLPDLAVSAVTTSDRSYLYVAAGNSGVFVYDIRDVTNIIQLYNFTSTFPQARARRLSFYQSESILLVAYEVGGLAMYDISDKTKVPPVLNTINLYGNTIGTYQDTIVLATQQIVYILTKASNYDTTNPNNSINIGIFIRNIRVFVLNGKPYAFLTLGDQGIQVLDIQLMKIVQYYAISKSETFDVAVDSTGKYAFAALTIYGVDMFDISTFGTGTLANPQKPLVQILQNTNYYYSIFIINNHIYASSYGRGVQIYSMTYTGVSSNPISLTLVQEIILVGDTTTIYTDSLEQYLFSTKNNILHINSRTSQSLENVDLMPNLFNFHQQLRFAIENQYYNVAWDSYLYKDHYLIVPYGNLYMLDVTDFASFKSNSYKLDFSQQTGSEQPSPSKLQDMQAETILSTMTVSSSIDGLAVDEVNNILFLGRNAAGVYAYSITFEAGSNAAGANPKDHYILTLLAQLTGPQFEVNDIALVTNGNIITLYCALGVYGAGTVTYNIANKAFGPIKILYPLTDDFQNSKIVKVLPLNNRYLFAGARRYGVLVYDLQQPLVQVPLYKIRTAGGEDFEFTPQQDFLYVADFLNGLSIVDIPFGGTSSLIKSPSVVSRLLLDGQALMVMQLADPQFILVGQTGNKMISLVDVSDKKNPKLLQTLSPQIEVMQSFVVRASTNQIIMPTTRGLRLYTMSRPFDLFYEIMDVDKQVKLSYTSQFYVGQNLNIKLIPINLNLGQVYSCSPNLYLIQNLNMQLSPNYITFNPFINQISVTLNKDNTDGVMVMIAKFLFEIDESTFYNAGFITHSLDILSDAQQRAFLDSNNFPTEIVPSMRLWTSGSAVKYVETLISEPDAKYLIESLFNQKIIYYPIRLNVATSISFKPLSQDYLNSQIVTTLSKDLKITFINSDQSVGEFVNKKYDSVNVDLSSNKQRITISGDPTLVSKALGDLIFNCFLLDGFSITNDILSKTKIIVTIEDSINKPITTNYLHENLEFIQYNVAPSVVVKLQTQFDQSFSSGVISIEQDFAFSLATDTFSDSDQLQYKAFIVSGGSYTELTMKDPNAWLHFDNTTLKFTGLAGYSKLGSVAKIALRATDGYYTTEDSFQMKIYSIPFYIVFNRFIAAVSGLSGLIVVWKIRGMIHMIFCKKKIRYSTEIVKIGECYRKQIPVVIPYIERCSEFIDIFLKYITMNKKTELLKPNKTLFCIKRYKHPIEYFVESKQHNMNNNSILNQNGEVVESTNTQQNEFRVINMEKVIQMMVEYTSTIKSEDRIVPKKWFKSKTHISQRILQGLLNYQFMVELEKPTYKIFKQLKTRSIMRRKYKSAHYQFFSPLDWYLEFAKVEIKEEDIYNKENEVRLPSVTINHSKITKIYNQTDDDHNKKDFDNKMYEIDQQSFIEEDFAEADTLNIPNCNDQLLIENIKNYALGIVRQLGYFASVFQPARGTSIHTDPSTVYILKAMKKTSSQGIVRSVKELISMDYDDIELQVNRKLPNWLTCEWQNGSIFIKGTPEKKDVRNYQIRLEDVNQFILMNYKLLIVDGDKQKEQLLQPQHKDNLKQHLSFDDLEGVETLNVMIKRQKQIDKYNQLKREKSKKMQDKEQSDQLQQPQQKSLMKSQNHSKIDINNTPILKFDEEDRDDKQKPAEQTNKSTTKSDNQNQNQIIIQLDSADAD